MINGSILQGRLLPWAASVALCFFVTGGVGLAAGPEGVSPGPVRALPKPGKSSTASLRQIDLAVLAGGPAGAQTGEQARPFTVERAEALAGRIEMLANGASAVMDRQALEQAMELLPAFQERIVRASIPGTADEEGLLLTQEAFQLETLEGIALKGRHHAAAYRPSRPTPLPRGVEPSANPADLRFGVSKINTGWILDQHLFDPAATADYPSLYGDYRRFDEGRNDVVMGHSDHPTSDTMFGWVWQVQSFYWTEVTSDHPNASYCIIIMVSPDGGASWWLYSLLYDPATSPATSKDLINPKMAVDITGTTGGGPSEYDRLYVAYEYCYSPTDHDVYVYAETSVMDQKTCPPTCVTDPQDAAVGATASWEGNPAIAADYQTTETAYRVVAYQYAYSATDHDLYASQSTGNGSTWTAAAAVAATTAMETNPALTAGCTGDGGAVPFAAHMHLAYNFDASTSGRNLLLSDQGFESGPGGTAWYKSCGRGYALITTTSTHAGTYKATLGGYNSDHDYLSQLVTIPSDAAAAHLYFYLRMTTSETIHPYDFLYVRVWNSTGPPGTLLGTLATFSDADAAAYASWTLVGPIDLSAYIGQTVRIGFEATTDSASVTYFYIDDTLLSLSLSRVQYARGAHAGGNYPSALQGFSKIAAFGSIGSPPWPYGAPAIAASHGGSSSATGGRVLVAADQLFPADQPTAGDPQRYQLWFAVNMCNGGTGCGDITPACTPDPVSRDWNAYYFYDNEADYRFPALVVDGVGWVEGTSGIPQNGVVNWWEMFMGYYKRPLDSSFNFGDAEMIMADASDETCKGFQDGTWYLFTALENASDGDGKVVAKQGTLAAFNYFYGWPGLCFNKRFNHLGGTMNDDAYFTTPGDNYTIDTLHDSAHIEARFNYSGNSYLGPWTFAWPAGFQMTVTADADTVDDYRYYTFSQWDTGDTGTGLTVNTAYYTPGGQFCPYGPGLCQGTNLNALYDGGCLVSLPMLNNDVRGTRTGTVPTLSWIPLGSPGDIGFYTVYRASNPGAVGNFSSVGTTLTTSFTDPTATGNLYYYIVVAGCGPYTGPWGHYGQ